MNPRNHWQCPPSMDLLEAIRWLVVFVCEQGLDGRIDVDELKRMHRDQVEELRISRGLSSRYGAARELFALRRAKRCERLWRVYQSLRVLLRCDGCGLLALVGSVLRRVRGSRRPVVAKRTPPE